MYPQIRELTKQDLVIMKLRYPLRKLTFEAQCLSEIDSEFISKLVSLGVISFDATGSELILQSLKEVRIRVVNGWDGLNYPYEWRTVGTYDSKGQLTPYYTSNDDSDWGQFRGQLCLACVDYWRTQDQTP
jgi:hypothetical protein